MVGQQKPRSESLVVVGLARDCAAALPSTLAFCDALEGLFARVDFVLVENGSRDETREILERWALAHSNAVVLTPKDASETDERTQRIAACRNAALAFVQDRLADRHLLFSVDMDIDIGTDDAAPIAAAADFLTASTNTAGVFPNSSPVYYDIYALRHPFWCPDDVWDGIDDIWENFDWSDRALAVPEARRVHSRQLYLPVELAPIKVMSAFGGAGLYRLAAALEGTYRGVDDAGRATCEHVEFHRSVEGDLYILPSWCIRAPIEHLSSAFRTEHAHERLLRKIRHRRALRDRLSKRYPYLRPLLAKLIK